MMLQEFQEFPQDKPKKISDYVFLDFDEEFETAQVPDEDILYRRFDIEMFSDMISADGNDFLHTDDSANAAFEEKQQGALQNMPDIEGMIKEAEAEAQAIIEEAREQAAVIKQHAMRDAEDEISELKKKAYSEGYEKGSAEGREQALEESRAELQEQNKSLFEEVKVAITELERQKTDYIRQYNEEMKELVIAIAEKVIKISLKSSSEVIRRMILSAVESSYRKQWAKIYISDHDANLMVREDADILDALRNVSDRIKIIVMENGEPGDLMVEYPDQAIDSGVNTQLQNIREIMENAKLF